MRHGFISIAVFAALALAALPVRASETGDLIKGSGPAVYYVADGGKRLAFPNEAVYKSWYEGYDDVQEVSDAELASFALSGVVTMRPGVKMVKINSDPKVYAVGRFGVLRWIKDEVTARSMYGSAWNRMIVDVPTALFVSYAIGDPISDASQYSPTAERAATTTIVADRPVHAPAPSAPPAAPIVSATTTAPAPTPAPTPASAPIVKHILAILWDPHRLSDPAPPKSDVENKLFGATRSVKDYYRVMSGGKVEIKNAGVLGWYDADKPADHYWNHPTDAGDGFISGHMEKWVEAIRKADRDFDFKAYDIDRDGDLSSAELGILIVIPQSTPFGTNRWVAAQETPTLTPLMVDGVKIGMISEVYAGASTGFPVYAHEEGHLLFGFADMYGAPMPAQRYSLMDVTYYDSHLDPYHKSLQGWIDLVPVAEGGAYDVKAIEDARAALRIDRPDAPVPEYFIIENRRKGVYDTEIYDPGIVIWNIVENLTGDWGRTNIRMIRPVMPPDDGKASWHAGGDPAQAGPVALAWADGTASGVTVSGFPAPADTMRITIDMP